MRTERLNLLRSPILPLSLTAKQRVVIIPGDQPEEGIDGYVGKYFGKGKVFRRESKTPQEKSTSGGGSNDDGEELGDDEVLN